MSPVSSDHGCIADCNCQIHRLTKASFVFKLIFPLDWRQRLGKLMWCSGVLWFNLWIMDTSQYIILGTGFRLINNRPFWFPMFQKYSSVIERETVQQHELPHVFDICIFSSNLVRYFYQSTQRHSLGTEAWHWQHISEFWLRLNSGFGRIRTCLRTLIGLGFSQFSWV